MLGAPTSRDTLTVKLVTVFVASVVCGHDPETVRDHVTVNPPFAAGAFYCALDVLVMLSSQIRRQRG